MALETWSARDYSAERGPLKPPAESCAYLKAVVPRILRRLSCIVSLRLFFALSLPLEEALEALSVGEAFMV